MFYSNMKLHVSAYNGHHQVSQRAPPERDGDHDSRGLEQPQEEISMFIYFGISY